MEQVATPRMFGIRHLFSLLEVQDAHWLTTAPRKPTVKVSS